jgi:L-fucose mutarotase/ribose pyranase (RbsD/FucU family)
VLKGIDPLLAPELLKVLAEMGHGDEIVIADANFTATTLGRRKTVIQAPAIAVQRFAFYDRAQRADAIVLMGELQPYANFVFKKGVIGEPLVR